MIIEDPAIPVDIVKDKKILLIGSGEDLNGRNLGERISAENCEWDIIARVNKHYGDIKDVGVRTDIFFCANKKFAKIYKRASCFYWT